MTERAKVFVHKNRIARKCHICFECGATIQKREQYHFKKGLWSWGWDSFKICETCNEFYDELNDNLSAFDECIPFGQLYEEWAEREENHGKTRLDFRAYINIKKNI